MESEKQKIFTPSFITYIVYDIIALATFITLVVENVVIGEEIWNKVIFPGKLYNAAPATVLMGFTVGLTHCMIYQDSKCVTIITLVVTCLSVAFCYYEGITSATGYHKAIQNYKNNFRFYNIAPHYIRFWEKNCHVENYIMECGNKVEKAIKLGTTNLGIAVIVTISAWFIIEMVLVVMTFMHINPLKAFFKTVREKNKERREAINRLRRTKRKRHAKGKDKDENADKKPMPEDIEVTEIPPQPMAEPMV